jgi:hypothetical protein
MCSSLCQRPSFTPIQNKAKLKLCVFCNLRL